VVSRPRRSSRPVRRAAQIEEASFGSVTGSAPPLVECVLDHCYQAPPEARPPEVKGCRDFREVVRSRAGSGARGALRSVRSAGASPRRIFHLEGEHRGPMISKARRLSTRTRSMWDLPDAIRSAMSEFPAAATCRARMYTARGAKAEAVVRRWRFHSSPVLRNRPRPKTGPRTRIVGAVRT